MDQSLKNLMQALRQLVGDKVYLRGIEAKLESMELTPQEKMDFIYLVRDLNQKNSDISNLKNKPRFGL
jgi:hypothetical protein